MTYGNIYVAKVAMGANTNQTVKAFVEAEGYAGPSLIIAYSHCIAVDFEEYAYGENRYRTLKQSKPEVAAELIKLASNDASARYALMEQLAKLTCGQKREESVEPSPPLLSCPPPRLASEDAGAGESKKGGEKQTVGR
jgi:pyruvate-ferredoxin/flavodoxin oxidoreductase